MLLNAIGSGCAQPGHGRSNSCRLGLTETHVQTSAIGDVAAGEVWFLIRVKTPFPIRSAATASQRAPLRGPRRSQDSQRQSAMPSFRHEPGDTFSP